MSFGISNSVRSRAVQVCTPQLFHQATQSSVVKNTCAEIEDALESNRRGEMNQFMISPDVISAGRFPLAHSLQQSTLQAVGIRLYLEAGFQVGMMAAKAV